MGLVISAATEIQVKATSDPEFGPPARTRGRARWDRLGKAPGRDRFGQSSLCRAGPRRPGPAPACHGNCDGARFTVRVTRQPTSEPERPPAIRRAESRNLSHVTQSMWLRCKTVRLVTRRDGDRRRRPAGPGPGPPGHPRRHAASARAEPEPPMLPRSGRRPGLLEPAGAPGPGPGDVVPHLETRPL